MRTGLRPEVSVFWSDPVGKSVGGGRADRPFRVLECVSGAIVCSRSYFASTMLLRTSTKEYRLIAVGVVLRVAISHLNHAAPR